MKPEPILTNHIDGDPIPEWAEYLLWNAGGQCVAVSEGGGQAQVIGKLAPELSGLVLKQNKQPELAL